MLNSFHKGNHLKRIFGALRYGGKAGITGLFFHLISPLTKSIDKLISRSKNKKYFPAKGIMIIGPPRSGTTVLFQVISETFQSIPYTNAHYLFPFSGSNIYRKSLAKRKSKGYKLNSYHGYTTSISGVNEGNDIFNWVHEEGSKDQDIKNFEKIVAKLDPYENELVILKNIRAFNRIFRIYQASKNHQFIFVRVKRDIRDLVESSVDVYKETGSFHPIPDSMTAKEVGDPIEFAVDQILGIENEIEKQFANIPEKSKYIIKYEELCEDPEKHLKDLREKFSNNSEIKFRLTESLNDIKRSSREKVNDREAMEIEKLIQSRISLKRNSHEKTIDE